MEGERTRIIEEIFAYLLDHYWDSLEDMRFLLELHLNACKAQLMEVSNGR